MSCSLMRIILDALLMLILYARQTMRMITFELSLFKCLKLYSYVIYSLTVMNVLFLCTGNSCRSIIGEAIFNHLVSNLKLNCELHAYSAGSRPTGVVHPRALNVLHRHGVSCDGCHSKSMRDLSVQCDVVITVCGNAARESCPARMGAVHWGVDDPAGVHGDDDENDAAFEMVYNVMNARITAFLSLPLERLIHDEDALFEEMNKISSIC